MPNIRPLLFALLSLFLIAAPQVARAQDCGTYDSTLFNAASDSAEQKLVELEKLTSTILETGVMRADDEARIDALMDAYAADFFKAYQLAHEAASQASQSEGREGDGSLLTSFELQAQQHERRLFAVAATGEKVNAALVQGDIKLGSLGVPGGASPTQQLALGASPVRPEFLALAARGEAEQGSFGSMCKSAASAFGNLLVPTAEAALVFKCVKPCKDKNWAACWQCISSAGPAAIQAWNDFQSCWNKNSKWWHRTWCVLQLVARLA